jgi:hypothetical protein
MDMQLERQLLFAKITQTCIHSVTNESWTSISLNWYLALDDNHALFLGLSICKPIINGTCKSQIELLPKPWALLQQNSEAGNIRTDSSAFYWVM